MKKSIIINRDYLLDGYRAAISFQQKQMPTHSIALLKKMTIQLFNTIEKFEELRLLEDEYFEVVRSGYELGEGA